MNKHKPTIKQPLVTREQRVRNARHGKPHVKRTPYLVLREVPAGTPDAKRSVRTDATTGEVRVVYEARVAEGGRAFEPVTRPFDARVAAGPTTERGRENKPENMAPKGKQGAKPGPGGK